MSSPSTIAGIFRSAFDDYVNSYGPLPPENYRVANAIMKCRTPGLGAQRYECPECQEQQLHFNSCRNRHCPQCQGAANRQWAQSRAEEMLPVGYFHVVFTVPALLNALFLRNKEACYSILFRAVNETLQTLAGESRLLGARIGFIAVLHTWGQNLMDHPHIHCIVPAGGFRTDKNRWKHCRKDFLFPVAVVRKLYRGKFLSFLKEAISARDIHFHGNLAAFASPDPRKVMFDNLYEQDWVVYIKPPFSTPADVIRYLSNYTHRVAITNHRVKHFLSCKNGYRSLSYCQATFL